MSVDTSESPTWAPSDYSLLRAYVDEGSEGAFTELVGRYLGMVHASALRQTGRPDLAEEVSQAVFILLARKASSFDPKVFLGGWLFRSVRFAANDLLKAERRRQFRETAAYHMKDQEEKAVEAGAAGPGGDVLWTQVAPELDGCLSELGEKDRVAILLRFFEDKSFPEVGQALRLSEEAARKRVNRALDKLQGLLQRRGLTATALGLGSLLSAKAAGSVSASAMPAGLGSKVAGVAIAANSGAITATSATSAATLAKAVASHWGWMQAKVWILGVATVAVVGVVAGVVVNRVPAVSPERGPWVVGAREDYRVAGFPDARKVHTMIAELQAAVARGDARAVATHVRFPLRVNTAGGVVTVADPAALAAGFDQLFPAEVRAVLAKCPRAALFSSHEGVMIGSGDLWVTPAAADDPEPRLAVINIKPSGR